MPEPPARYLTPEQMDVAQLVRHTRGERIESPEYVKARNEALRAFGLEPDEPQAADKDPADMTVAEHFDRIRRK